MNEKSFVSNDLPRPLRDEHLVFLLPPNERERPGLRIRELWGILWGRKFWIVAITAFFSLTAVTYALLAEQWFKAEVVLIPARTNSGASGQLGGLLGLASLAGLSLNGRGDGVEALAVLRSDEFIRSFIDEYQLLPVLFADKWDSAARRWKSSNPMEQPDVRDAVRYFQRTICQVVEDQRTGLVTVSIEWKNRETAAEWANQLVARVNEQMRQRVLVQSENNVKFLREELAATNIATLQQSASHLLENEMQTLMLARGNQEFAFRVVDHASVPKWRSRPRRGLIVSAATLAGGFFAVFGVLLLHALRNDGPER